MTDELTSMAVSAAAVLVGQMAQDGWAAVRGTVARLFGRAGDAEAERQLALLDNDRDNLPATGPGVLQERWARRLTTLAEDYPDVADELAALAARLDETESAAINQAAHGNSGPVVQIGGDNHGGISLEGR
jgi:hypothetical protein